MGILTKTDGKKGVSVMVRMPSSITMILDMAVGSTHSSRPDFVIDGIRSFLHYIINEEAGLMLYLQEKDTIDYDVKLQFYYEAIKNRTEAYRNSVHSAQERDGKKVVDILLSVPKGLLAEVERTVERTKCFRNHQEFIKCATFYRIALMGADNTNTMLTENFLISNNTTKDLRDQISIMKKEMETISSNPKIPDIDDIINDMRSKQETKDE